MPRLRNLRAHVERLSGGGGNDGGLEIRGIEAEVISGEAEMRESGGSSANGAIDEAASPLPVEIRRYEGWAEAHLEDVDRATGDAEEAGLCQVGEVGEGGEVRLQGRAITTRVGRDGCVAALRRRSESWRSSEEPGMDPSRILETAARGRRRAAW